ncbi:DUF3168 domain-containing protein [Arvimicrobium flavum]|uniref:DUF3168 domain-containing protein n=1 Tax=Arvimicrobium flavum TaxID=3393320 RepID=UPI00237AA5B5|nr:DUF3168 domain-containing protein [Mesorhizobium shangrilense]
MTAAASELQKAIFDALKGDATLIALLEGAKIYDHAPPNVVFPYLTFGRTSIYDWSTGTEIGTEQLFTLHVWSKAKGRKETLDIMELAQGLLHDRPLTLESQALVNCRLEFAEARHDEDLLLYHGLLRFRAVTEGSE